MRGVPKDPRLRQRRNKASTRAVLAPDSHPAHWPPALPKRSNGARWHPMTRVWWSTVWSSPLAADYLTSDANQLLRLALLVDAFYRVDSDDNRISAKKRLARTLRIAREIRLLEREFGLTPKARMGLASATLRVATHTRR